ncbi:hypothetical protein EDD86DRAFT_197731 [Gorgonomyces haynaldii]|nr:hypothetical protein EDD86DRAFT_197731 [Gorgonomyces haynaldii]
MKPNKNHFIVSVDRVDSLIDTDLNRPVAARVQHVLLNFDVDPVGQVTVNEVPVPLGVSHLQIQAKTWAGGNADLVEMDDAMSQFDVGLVDVGLHVTGVTINKDGVEVRKLVIAEEIHEIDGVKMHQSVAMQQVLEVMDGQVTKHTPCAADSNLIGRPSGMHAVHQRFKHLPQWLRIVFIVVHSLVFTFLVALIFKGIYFASRGIYRYVTGYRPVESQDLEGDQKADEKLPLYEEKQ